MSKWQWQLVALCAVTCCAARSSAQNYTVNAQDLYIRAAPNGFAIGTLFYGNAFKRQQTGSLGYYWGRCGGNAQMCGWVSSEWLTPGGTINNTCGGSGSTATGLAARHYLIDNYAKCINDYRPGHWYIGGDTPNNVRILPGMTAHLYGNYNGTTFHNQRTTVALDSTAPLAWRWVSQSGEAVMVKLQDGPWAFMRRDKLPTKLRYKDGNDYTDWQGAGN